MEEQSYLWKFVVTEGAFLGLTVTGMTYDDYADLVLGDITIPMTLTAGEKILIPIKAEASLSSDTALMALPILVR
jgi:hypothetical protein